jgi:enediyne biosynthesis thioesterase
LGELQQSRVTMSFEYWRIGKGGEEELIARGEQQAACMRNGRHGLEAAAWPPGLRDAIRKYSE